MMMRLATFSLALVASLSFQAQMDLVPRWPSSDDLLGLTGDGPSGSEVNVAETYTEANRLIIEENWAEAEALMAVLLEAQPENRNFAFKRALCLRAIPGRLAEAVPLVHRAVDGPFASRYNAFSIDEVLPPEEALELGLEVLQFAYHFAEAQALAQVIAERYPKRDYRHQRALEVIEECNFASHCVKSPVRMSIEPEGALNSSSADYAPVVTPDGQTLYFTSHRGGNGRTNEPGQIYRSIRVGNTWSRPVRMDIGTPGRDVTTVSIIGDGESLIAYQGYRNEGSIWKLTPDEYGGWTQEEKLGFPVDSRHWETSLSERFDGWERVFVSDRPGGLGGRDLYRTVKLPDGTWSEPLNLGRRINSAGDEESPVLSADGQTLVFASTGRPGMGGFDLYRCRRLDNGSWSDPEHLGHPLNTPGDEAVLTLDASGSAGYISSTRGGGDDLNIYHVEFLDDPAEVLAVMIGEVMAWRNGDVMEVRSVDEGAAVFRVFRARKGSGKFLAALPPCREYNFSWIRDGETLMERRESIGCEAAYGVSQEVIRLAPFGEGGPVESPDPEMPVIEEEDGRDLAGTTTGLEEPTEEPMKPAVSEMSASADAGGGDALPVRGDDEEDSPAGTADAVVTGPEVNRTEATEATVSPEVAAADATAVAEPAPVTMIEFGAVSEQIEFGYGKYLPQSGSRELVSMALSIMERRDAGEIPVLQIEGSASFVPVKNKRAYETNEQLARMRAEKARDAMIQELAKRGLQVGVDYQIVLEWRVAGPDYRGDAVEGVQTYRSYQFAKFALSRTLVEQRH